MGEAGDGIVGVVLAHGNSAAFEVEDLDALGLAAFRGIDELEGAGPGDDEVLRTILVSECMSTDDNWLLPTWHESGDARNDNWFTENSSASGGEVLAGGLFPRYLKLEAYRMFLIVPLGDNHTIVE